MTDASSYGLRELAHKYYTGELSFELYRRERTLLLDRLTQQDDDDTNEPITRPMLEKPGASHASGFRWLRSLLILIALSIMIIIIIWLIKPEWLVRTQARVNDGMEIAMINANQAVRQDSEEYEYLNG